jgi:Tol biopolymer transport system component
MMNSPTLTAMHGTQLGVILGTAAYMAPEQAKGLAIDKRADIWAFGVVLYEMLSGARLFEGDSVPETLAGVLKTEIDFARLPADLSPSLRQLVRRCLQRNPKNRLHDIADARLVIDEVLRGEDPRQPAAASEALPRGATFREKIAWGLALLGLVLAAGAAVTSRRQAGEVAGGTMPVTRFAVTPEEKGRLQSFPALAPDGRTMVYSLQPEEGPVALWAYSFETGASRKIAGTEGAQQPFWSPDGRNLAFFSGGQLKRLDLASGLSQSLASATDPRGGVWGEDGRIYYAAGASTALSAVPAASGPSRAVTELETSRGAQSHRFPLALPGGALIYTCQGGPEVRGIYWRGPGAGPARRIVESVSRASFDTRGFLFWIHDGALVAQRFDPAAGTLSGELVPIAAKVGADEQAAAEDWYSLSPTGTIAFRTGTRAHTELRWFDRSGAALAAVTSAARLVEPALSPDGSRVAVQVNTVEAGTGPIWIYDTSAFDRSRRLTFGPSREETPVWSPDGKWVAYSSARTNGWSLFRKAADGTGDEELLYGTGGSAWIDSWAPDGRSLVFEVYSAERGADLLILPLDGSGKATPFLETPANEAHAALSPDGRLLAYVSDEGGVGQVYVRAIATPGSHWQISRDGADWPLWRADGKELFFGGHDGRLYAVPIAGLEPFAPGAPAPLFRVRTPPPKVTSNKTYYCPAPDGKRFLVNQIVGDPDGGRIEVVMNWKPPAEAR